MGSSSSAFGAKFFRLASELILKAAYEDKHAFPNSTKLCQTKGVSNMSQIDSGTALWRLDCGKLGNVDGDLFSQGNAYANRKFPLVNSSYLIRHDNHYIIWDTGLATEGPERLDHQIAKLGLDVSDISKVILSHNHADHTGQARLFPGAELILGAADWEEVRSVHTGVSSNPYVKPEDFDPWLQGSGRVRPSDGILDLFGDGFATVEAASGHTRGSQVLHLNLPQSGAFILPGDVAYFEEQFIDRNVTKGSFDVQLSLDAIDKVRAFVEAHGAMLILGHDPAHIARLPVFPEPAI